MVVVFECIKHQQIGLKNASLILANGPIWNISCKKVSLFTNVTYICASDQMKTLPFNCFKSLSAEIPQMVCKIGKHEVNYGMHLIM